MARVTYFGVFLTCLLSITARQSLGQGGTTQRLVLYENKGFTGRTLTVDSSSGVDKYCEDVSVCSGDPTLDNTFSSAQLTGAWVFIALSSSCKSVDYSWNLEVLLTRIWIWCSELKEYSVIIYQCSLIISNCPHNTMNWFWRETPVDIRYPLEHVQLSRPVSLSNAVQNSPRNNKHIYTYCHSIIRTLTPPFSQTHSFATESFQNSSSTHLWYSNQLVTLANRTGHVFSSSLIS
jgi:hypothetical protein